MVPSGALQCSSCLLAFWLLAPPADPVASVLADVEPICILAQPDSPSAAARTVKSKGEEKRIEILSANSVFIKIGVKANRQ